MRWQLRSASVSRSLWLVFERERAMIYDISPPITQNLAVWPGDTPLSREVLCDIARGDNLTLSTLRATVHLGAHADAPSHYGRDAATMEQCSLDAYLGPCQVIRVNVERATRIVPEQITVELETERVLLATGTFPDPTRFNEEFAALSPSARRNAPPAAPEATRHPRKRASATSGDVVSASSSAARAA